jgi:insertion element IS1 protein InsB
LERWPEELSEGASPATAPTEIDEMWSFMEKKSQQRWLWHAIDHRTGIILADVLGTHQDRVFLQ